MKGRGPLVPQKGWHRVRTKQRDPPWRKGERVRRNKEQVSDGRRDEGWQVFRRDETGTVMCGQPMEFNSGIVQSEKNAERGPKSKVSDNLGAREGKNMCVCLTGKEGRAGRITKRQKVQSLQRAQGEGGGLVETSWKGLTGRSQREHGYPTSGALNQDIK